MALEATESLLLRNGYLKFFLVRCAMNRTEKHRIVITVLTGSKLDMLMEINSRICSYISDIFLIVISFFQLVMFFASSPFIMLLAVSINLLNLEVFLIE